MNALTLLAAGSLAALLAPAQAQMSAVQTKAHAAASLAPQPVGETLSGTGYGVLVTPGLEPGYLVAALKDQNGTRRFTMVGESIEAIPLTPVGGYGFGVIHGSLVAPGVQLPMHGHYVLELDGTGAIVAQVFEPMARPGAPFAAIGWIDGTLQAAIPEPPSLADVPVRPIVDPLYGGIEAAVSVRWSLAQ